MSVKRHLLSYGEANITALSILFLCCFLTQSQSFAADFGVSISLGQNKLVGDDVDHEIKEEVGFRVGVPMSFNLNEHFDLRTGFFYAYRKYQVQGIDELGEDFKYEMRLNYLDIPFLFKFNLTDWLGLFAGPTVAFNINGRAKGQTGGISLDMQIDNVRTTYLLGSGGINLDLGTFGLDIFYERGFNKVYKEDGGDADFTFVGVNLIYWFNKADDYSYESSSRYRFR